MSGGANPAAQNQNGASAYATVSAYATDAYQATAGFAVRAHAAVSKRWDDANVTVSNFIASKTTQEATRIAMKFFKALPETLMALALLCGGKIAFMGALCWAVRTVISLMPLLKALTTLNSAEISRGAEEALKRLIAQHKNFLPIISAFAIISTWVALRGNLAQLAATAVYLSAIIAMMHTFLTDSNAAPAALAGQPQNGVAPAALDAGQDPEFGIEGDGDAAPASASASSRDAASSATASSGAASFAASGTGEAIVVGGEE